jgi:hypothetical protein
LEVTNHQLRFAIYALLKIFGSVDFWKEGLRKGVEDFTYSSIGS